MSIKSSLLGALLLMTIPVFGQTNSKDCKATRVAFYNEVALDGKNGVNRLYEAYLAAESGGFITKKRTLDEVKSDYDRRYKILVEPVLSDIRQTITNFAVANDIQIFDAARLDNTGKFLYIDTKVFIDAQLIQFLNLPPNPNLAAPTIKIKTLKLAAVNTNMFFDPRTGLRGFELDDINRKNEFCDRSKKCAEIGKFAAKFASEAGFDVIFDSSKDLPTELNNLVCKDVTGDFIYHYNRQLVETR